MRPPGKLILFSAILASLALSALLMTRLEPPQDTPWENLIPSGIAGFAVVEDIEEAYSLLQRGAFDELLGTQLLSWTETAGPGQGALVARLNDLPVRMLCVVVHSFERRAASRYKLNFSVIFIPGAAGLQNLTEQVDAFLRETLDFYEPDQGAEGIHIYRGKEPRQVLYRAATGPVLVVSNGRDFPREIQGARSGELPRLTDQATYRLIASELPRRDGLFLYLNGRQLLGLFPEMGWRFWIQDGQVRQAFYAAPR